MRRKSWLGAMLVAACGSTNDAAGVHGSEESGGGDSGDPSLSPECEILVGPTALDFDVDDADVDPSSGWVVIAPDDRVLALDPTTGEIVRSVDVPGGFGLVSAGPGPGARVAVGVGVGGGVGDGSVVHVELASSLVLDAFPLPAAPRDVVLAGNGFLYATATAQIASIDLSTGTSVLAGDPLSPEPLLLVDPSGDWLYAATPFGESLSRYSIASGPAMESTSLPVPEDGFITDLGEQIWLTESGSHVVTQRGYLIAFDGAAAGRLPATSQLLALDHHEGRGRFVLTDEAEDGFWPGVQLHFHDDVDLDRVVSCTLPPHPIDEKPRPILGRYAFFSADGTAVQVLGTTPWGDLVLGENNWVFVSVAVP